MFPTNDEIVGEQAKELEDADRALAAIQVELDTAETAIAALADKATDTALISGALIQEYLAAVADPLARAQSAIHAWHEGPPEDDGLGPIARFERGFRELCQELELDAAFVLARKIQTSQIVLPNRAQAELAVGGYAPIVQLLNRLIASQAKPGRAILPGPNGAQR